VLDLLQISFDDAEDAVEEESATRPVDGQVPLMAMAA
jgi:hypothetical protein